MDSLVHNAQTYVIILQYVFTKKLTAAMFSQFAVSLDARRCQLPPQAFGVYDSLSGRGFESLNGFEVSSPLIHSGSRILGLMGNNNTPNACGGS